MHKRYKIEVSPASVDTEILLKFHSSVGKSINNAQESVAAFEAGLHKVTNAPHVLAISSGTAALHLSLLAIGVGEGDCVICPTFTFVATVNTIRYVKAEPVFVDSENETMNISPELLEAAIVSESDKGKNIKAVIVVHAFGMPAKLQEIIAICNKYHIMVIEDAASALGSSYKEQALGTFGKTGILSFNYNKIITTTGGGIILSPDKQVVDKASYLSNQAKQPVPYYEHLEVGYNYRMSGICAELGNVQLPYLEQKVKAKRDLFGRYYSAINNIEGLSFIEEPASCFSNRWITTIHFEKDIIQKAIKEKLEANCIEARFLWKPMHLQPVFSSYSHYLNGNAERFFNTGLCLPSGLCLEEKEQQDIINHIVSVF